MEELIGFVVLILGVVVFLWFILLPFNMARTRGRCGLCWLIASIFITTIGAIILLALMVIRSTKDTKKSIAISNQTLLLAVSA